MDLMQIMRLSDAEARQLLEEIRWPEGPICPHCGAMDRIYRLDGQSHRDGLYKCGHCRDPFTVTVGTVMHRTHLPLSKWIAAFYMMCSSKKGVSALQLQRNLGIGSYKTAWHMCHRIRLAMKEEPLVGMLSGTVEVDESYFGGKLRKSDGPKRLVGRGHPRKTAVLALVERGGRAYATPVDRVNAATLGGAIRQLVDRKSRLMTDDLHSYRTVGREYPSHGIVRHSRGEYALGDTHTQTVESFFGLMKRGVMGSFHHVSKKHLQRYCDEFSFRWNYRNVSDYRRTMAAIDGSGGKRLLYMEPVK